jgi:MGT family glycosyltransferase
MRVLQSMYDAGGGVPPQLAVTRRLVERGHEVRVLAHETLRGRVESRGARLVPLLQTLPGHDMTTAATDLVRDWEPSDPLEAAARFRDLVLFGPAAANAHEVLVELSVWRPDVIVLDWLLFGTALAAESAQVPAVVLIHSPYPLRKGEEGAQDFFAPGLVTMNAARAELGLGPLDHWDEQLLRCAALLSVAAPELDPASSTILPANVHHVGPATEPSTESWVSPWDPSDTDPLVLVSFSTTYMAQQDLAARVLEAVATLPVRVLLTTGPALGLDGVRIPDNVRVSTYIPHDAVLPQTALVITHAGFGTVQAAAAAGVPMVCLPCGRDQPGNAAHVAALGVGVVASPNATVEDLRAVIAGALADSELRDKAQSLGKLVSQYDGTAAIVAQVEALA